MLITPLVLVVLWFMLFGGTLDKSRGDILREFAVLLAADVLLALWRIRTSERRLPWK